MRILFIASDFPNPLQPTKGVFNLALVKGLSLEHQVRVISPISWLDERSAKKAIDRKTSVDGISIWHPRYVYPPKVLRSKYDWFYRRSVRDAVKEATADFHPDAVVGYWAHPDGAVAAEIAKQFDAASAIIAGGSDVLLITKEPARRKAVTQAFKNADAVVTVNQHLKDAVIKFGIESEKTHVWSQGVDDTIFHPGDRAAARRKLQINGDVPIVICVARLVPVKGIEVLLDAAANASRRGASFHLYLLGDGPLRESLSQQAENLGVKNFVTFVGPKGPADLGDWYRAADLTVLSSHSEGLPNVLRESVACGTPFLATNVGGINEIAGESDRLVPAGNPAALADGIIEMLARRGSYHQRHLPNWAESAEALVAILQQAGAKHHEELMEVAK